jgi:transcriptional regulator with XRE-family HTH domain
MLHVMHQASTRNVALDATKFSRHVRHMTKQTAIDKWCLADGRPIGELAEYLGVDRSTLHRWRTGKSFPDRSRVWELGTLTGIEHNALLGIEPKRRAKA